MISDRTLYDVAILGSGIGGTILAAILARHGLSVLLIEQASHPRFAIGESTVPETTMLFRVLAARYDVPEIAHLASYQAILRNVCTSCGVKRNFSFVHHSLNQQQRPEETTQSPTAAPPIGPDVHLFRQDVDAYMLTVAIKYGAAVSQRTNVENVEIDEQGVLLRASGGREFRARYVVDAGGMKSMLATRFGLRTATVPLETRSRSIYTHMMGVLPYDDVMGSRAHGLPSPLGQGTLHHLFEGGWIWIIPFNNHACSKNPLVSVGMNLNIDRYPEQPGLDPEQEFRRIVDTLPQVKQQLATARAVREWSGTGRLQFWSDSAVGNRYCMLPHAFSFVDPLYSSGLGVTMNAINAIAWRLIRAKTDGDYSAERFADVDRFTKWNFRYFDRLVSRSYTSFSDFKLWNAWMRIWLIGGTLGAFGAFELLHRVRKSRVPLHDRGDLEIYPFRGAQGSELSEFSALFEAASAVMDEHRAGHTGVAETASGIFSLVRESGLWPRSFGEVDPGLRHPGTFRAIPLLKAARWYRRESPGELRRYYFAEASLTRGVAETASDCAAQIANASAQVLTLLRDYVRDWNDDCRMPAPLPLIRPEITPEPAEDAASASPAANGHAGPVRTEAELVRAGAP